MRVFASEQEMVMLRQEIKQDWKRFRDCVCCYVLDFALSPVASSKVFFHSAKSHFNCLICNGFVNHASIPHSNPLC